MTFIIDKDEATQARRRVPFKVFASNGTSPETGFSDATVLHTVNGGAQVVSNNSASAVSVNAGMYYIEFDAAEIATLGNYAIYTDAVGADFAQHVANFQVVNFNPMSAQSNMAGNVASVFTVGVTSTATIAGTTNTATLINALNDIDGSGVTLHAGTHSSATIDGVNRVNSNVTIADADYSAVTVRAHSSSTIAGVTNVATQITALNDIDGSAVTLHAGVHSGATVAINDATGDVSSRFTVAVESGATIAGVTNTATLIGALNDIDGSAVTLHAGTHSGVTLDGVTEIGSNVTLHAGTHSSVTIAGVTEVGSGVTIVGSSLSQVADAFLTRSLAGSAQTDKRSVQNALRALRNRVQADSSVLTVYQEDDSTSAWTASATTSADPSGIVHIDPL